LQHLGWMKELAHNPHLFDHTLFGVVDLTRSALGPKGLYLPAMVIVIASAVVQYYQSKQLMPSTKDGKSLRTIMRDAKSGKQADQAEMSAAIGGGMRYFIPVMIFIFTVQLASALSLYWLVGGIVAYIQQSIILREDTEEMEDLADKPDAKKSAKGSKTKNVAEIAEAEVVPGEPEPAAAKTSADTKRKKPAASTRSKNKKRRKK
jgi:membrane protein insertase Oxa1/YidC/SpoIIIJ